jgi:hypothetical protein
VAATLAWFRTALTLDESYLVRIEGCNVVQYKYQRGKDAALLLQYSQGQPVSHGNWPVVAVETVNGKPVEIIQGQGAARGLVEGQRDRHEPSRPAQPSRVGATRGLRGSTA